MHFKVTERKIDRQGNSDQKLISDFEGVIDRVSNKLCFIKLLTPTFISQTILHSTFVKKIAHPSYRQCYA